MRCACSLHACGPPNSSSSAAQGPGSLMIASLCHRYAYGARGGELSDLLLVPHPHPCLLTFDDRTVSGAATRSADAQCTKARPDA